ncbi:MAG TPA: pyridoxal phosphate-dependent aminotransferase family protein [Humidesulfovibrio sp.]|uniref:aminotransferase class I/II-fold pyridoxal phosphate-dependent enzyme n=1 Tax=Humidesulfovibrio sp. TaxID=2910988 RepID=UPI002BCC1F85|nr:pyridoxal phosphate-dependent aminotransferase family protein [Humidesulfovibrio sp.]HWR04160.1 pyridoxal phosphate-dependent aminotransferase family protein [Humidesulfovibrio sp.]
MVLTPEKSPLLEQVRYAKLTGKYPLYRQIEQAHGPEVIVDGKKMVMVGSNDYLGLASDPRVIEAATIALQRFGTGAGGSRVLCGNLSLHHELETRIAAFLNKRWAVLYTTGFMANHGVISSLAGPGDILLCDRDCHASIFEGCMMSRAKIVTYAHNDFDRAAKKLQTIMDAHENPRVFLLTEGVFSMSGQVAHLGELHRLKAIAPKLVILLDDAHGFGVLGQGHGTAHAFGCTDLIDIITGTFSKALASIGGFVATDDEDLKDYLLHQSRTLLFSAGLPASNTAAALKCLDIIESEPERIEQLMVTADQARASLQALGFEANGEGGPIVPVLIGQEGLAQDFCMALHRLGVFAVPAVYPAVSKGKAIIRLSFNSAHTESHLCQVLEAFAKASQQLGMFSPSRKRSKRPSFC